MAELECCNVRNRCHVNALVVYQCLHSLSVCMASEDSVHLQQILQVFVLLILKLCLVQKLHTSFVKADLFQ